MSYVIEALNGPLEGSAFAVGNRVIIGREADVDVQLVQKGVSRQHAAVIANDDDEYYLMDLASHNGTFLHDESIGRESLKAGDKFTIGTTDFLFRKGQPMATLETEASTLHLASGPAISATVDAQELSQDQLAELRSLKDK